MSKYWQVWVRWMSDTDLWAPYDRPCHHKLAMTRVWCASKDAKVLEVALCPAIGPPDGFSILGCKPEPRHITLLEARELALEIGRDADARRLAFAKYDPDAMKESDHESPRH